MHELVTRISTTAGITTEQALKAVEAVKDFVKEKFPMMAGAVDNLFASEATAVDVAAAPVSTVGATAAIPDPSAPVVQEPTMLDKISDVIPGETGQKVEDFVKGAAHKAEDVYDSVKEKLNGMFGGDKK
jgi:hypothetical protein